MEYQLQEEEFIEVKSPIDRLKERWTAQSSSISFLRQLNLIQQNPELVQYAELARIKGWSQSLMFALQGLLLAAVLLSSVNWLLTKDRGKQTDEIAAVKADLETEMKRQQGVIDAAQWEISRIKKSAKSTGFTVGSSGPLTKEDALLQLDALIEKTGKSQQEYTNRAAAKEKELHALSDALALAACGTPVVFSLALIFAAQVFRRGLYKDYSQLKLTRQADSFYLYSSVSRGLWINCVFIFLLNVVLSGSAYGLGHLFEFAGLAGATIFWLAMYALLLYFFYSVSQHLYKMMQVPAPRNTMSLENRILLRMHNSFWLVFLAFEAGLLALSYVSYLVARKV